MMKTNQTENTFGGNLAFFDFSVQLEAVSQSKMSGYFVMTWDKNAARSLPNANQNKSGEGLGYIYCVDGLICDARIGDKPATSNQKDEAVDDFLTMVRIALQIKSKNFIPSRMDFYEGASDTAQNLNWRPIDLVHITNKLETE